MVVTCSWFSYGSVHESIVFWISAMMLTTMKPTSNTLANISGTPYTPVRINTKTTYRYDLHHAAYNGSFRNVLLRHVIGEYYATYLNESCSLMNVSLQRTSCDQSKMLDVRSNAKKCYIFASTLLSRNTPQLRGEKMNSLMQTIWPETECKITYANMPQLIRITDTWMVFFAKHTFHGNVRFMAVFFLMYNTMYSQNWQNDIK